MKTIRTLISNNIIIFLMKSRKNLEGKHYKTAEYVNRENFRD